MSQKPQKPAVDDGKEPSGNPLRPSESTLSEQRKYTVRFRPNGTQDDFDASLQQQRARRKASDRGAEASPAHSRSSSGSSDDGNSDAYFSRSASEESVPAAAAPRRQRFDPAALRQAMQEQHEQAQREQEQNVQIQGEHFRAWRQLVQARKVARAAQAVNEV